MFDRAAYDRMHYAENRESIRARQREYRRTSSKFKAYEREYKKAHQAQQTEWQRTSATRRAWLEENREHVLQQLAERSQTWRVENRARYNAKNRAGNHLRRARLRGAPGRFTAEQAQARIDYFGGLCWVCGGPGDTLDHVIPLARGGSNWPSNLRPACQSCNSRRGARVPA